MLNRSKYQNQSRPNTSYNQDSNNNYQNQGFGNPVQSQYRQERVQYSQYQQPQYSQYPQQQFNNNQQQQMYQQYQQQQNYNNYQRQAGNLSNPQQIPQNPSKRIQYQQKYKEEDYLKNKSKYADTRLEENEYKKIPKVFKQQDFEELERRLNNDFDNLPILSKYKKEKMNLNSKIVNNYDKESSNSENDSNNTEEQEEKQRELQRLEEEQQLLNEKQGLIQRLKEDHEIRKLYEDTKNAFDNIKGEAKKENYLNLFGVQRGKCKLCPLDVCQGYKGCYNISNFGNIDLFQCLNCKCAMNAHEIEKEKQSFSNDISSLLSNKYLSSEHLNFQSMVGIFYVYPYEKEVPLSTHSQKSKHNVKTKYVLGRELKYQTEKCHDVDLEQFVQVLNEGCFDIVSYYTLTRQELQDKLIEKKIFSIKRPVQKSSFEDLYTFIISILKSEKTMDENLKGDLRKAFADDKDIGKYQYYEHIKKKILNKINQAFGDESLYINKQENEPKIYVMLITSKYSNPYTQFRRFFVSARNDIPKQLEFYYSSKYKYKGIIDTQLFFPTFFRIHLSTFVLTQHYPSQLIEKQTKQKITSQKLKIYDNTQEKEEQKKKERFFLKLNFQFRDMLDFNSFESVNENIEDKNRQDFTEAFSFMSKNTSGSFLDYVQASQNKINMQIAQKIGPPLLTQISHNPPNFYRITDQFENQTILNKYCSGLGNSQRVTIVLRPIIVRSNIDEVLINVYRLNNFIIIKRVYKLLSEEEAILLGQIEGIKRDNMRSYIKYMRDGMVAIILMSRPGAQSQSKLLSNGCEKGLKMQKTNFLDDLFIHHESDTGIRFKEKVSKEFFNIYQSQQNLNMFAGIKDFFSLERLIFMEEKLDQDMQNMFIHEGTNQVFFKKPSEIVYKQFNPTERRKIMTDINNETYNFFLYSTDQEMKTEQICSMFMPDCSIIQNVLVIIKPAYINKKTPIFALLQRLKYKIIHKGTSILDENMGERLIHTLEVLKLSEQDVKAQAQKFKNDIFIISLVKPAGFKEMISFLKGFKVQSDEKQRQIIYEKNELEIEDLKEMLIPCWNDMSHSMVQGLLNSCSNEFDGDTFQSMDYQNQKYCLDYMLQVTFAVNLYQDRFDKEQKKITPIEIKNPLYTQRCIHLKAPTKDLGVFEVRVFKFIAQKDLQIQIDEIRNEFRLQSWYYSLINVDNEQRAPLSYQARIFPDSIQKEEKPTHIFDVQEYCGNFFIETLAKLMSEQRDLEVKNPSNRQKQKEPYARQSLISYLWGMKLAQFVKELEQLQCHEIEGFGPIVKKGEDNFYTGDHLDENLLQDEKEKYYTILQQLFTKSRDFSFKETDQEQIKSKLNTILNSDVYLYSRQQNNRRILPQFIDNENLRVRDDVLQIPTKIFGQFSFLDDTYEQTQTELKKLQNIYQKEENDNKKDRQTRKDQWRINQEKKRQEKERLQRENKWDEDQEEQYQNNFDSDDSDTSLAVLKKSRRDQGYLIKKSHKLKSEEKQQLIDSKKKMLNTFSLAYVNPEIRSKYGLAAQIIYLLQINLKYLNRKTNVCKFNSKIKNLKEEQDNEYDFLINGIIEGFQKHYQMDKHDINYLEVQHQEGDIVKDGRIIPDLINMEVFLVIMEQIKRCLDMISDLDKQLDELNQQKSIRDQNLKQQQNLLSAQKHIQVRQQFENPFEMNEVNKYDELIKNASNRQQDLKNYVKKLVSILKQKYNDTDEYQNMDEQQQASEKKNFFDLDIKFNYEESRSKQIEEDNKAEKQRVFRNQYFMPMEQEEGYVVEDYGDERFLVDMAQTENQQKVLKKYPDAVFFKDVKTDETQKKWFNKKPLNIAHIRQVEKGKQKASDFILIEKPNANDNEEDEAIDKVIQKFYRDQEKLQQKEAAKNNYKDLEDDEEDEYYKKVKRY